jgi:CRISPR-associated protein Cmr2
MHQPQDPITMRTLTDDEVAEAQRAWTKCWLEFSAEQHSTDLAQGCRRLVRALSEAGRSHQGRAPRIPLCAHSPDNYLSDHALLTSAIAYCLAYDDKDLNERDCLLLRLAALSHELPVAGMEADTGDLRNRIGMTPLEVAERSWIEQAWQLVDEQAARLENAAADGDTLAAFASELPNTGDRRLDLLWYAHLAASQPLGNRQIALSNGQPEMPVIGVQSDFHQHPLALVPEAWKRIGLMHGGATKIKEYVFESAKLPEIRGASALLDRLNLSGTRALFGDDSGQSGAVLPLVDAPECVVYANGGDVLALAPASMAQSLADAIEQRYIEETLTAQCVAVAGIYSLLELQYGLDPTSFWADDYLSLLRTASEQDDKQGKKLLQGYYGAPKEGETDEQLFYLRKSFGELTTELALKRFWRREGNEGPWLDHPAQNARSLAHLETLPFGQRCSSCDRRIAVQTEGTTGDVLCEPCLRKRSAGWKTRAMHRDSTGFLEAVTAWRPGRFTPWPEQFRWSLEQWSGAHSEQPDMLATYLRDHEAVSWTQIDSAEDLDQIGQAAMPGGFIGLVYADGNNVGALIERIRTAGFYRQFASRLFEATKAAVFNALAGHLHPVRVKDDRGQDRLIHPFEIVSIGGDDLLLIVPADKALPITLDIARFIEDAFQNGDTGYRDEVAQTQRYRNAEFKASGRPVISLSAGVVLAQKSNPIFFLQDMVEELLRSAKGSAKRLKQEHGYTGGTVDFMVLKSVTMVTSSVGEFRQTALRRVKQWDRSDRQEVLHLTARPYTLHELDGLLQTAAALQRANFPRSQLYHLRQELPKGRLLSSLSYLYFTSGLDEKKAITVRKALDHSWHGIDDPAPWRRRGRQSQCRDGSKSHDWETILADIIEIYDFARDTGQEE